MADVTSDLPTWARLAQAGVMVGASFLVWLLKRSIEVRWLGRLEELEKRMERAGGAMSDLASDVQGMPEGFRIKFIEPMDGRVKVLETSVAVLQERSSSHTPPGGFRTREHDRR